MQFVEHETGPAQERGRELKIVAPIEEFTYKEKMLGINDPDVKFPKQFENTFYDLLASKQIAKKVIEPSF
jgi:hypothetical protein